MNLSDIEKWQANIPNFVPDVFCPRCDNETVSDKKTEYECSNCFAHWKKNEPN